MMTKEQAVGNRYDVFASIPVYDEVFSEVDGAYLGIKKYDAVVYFNWDTKAVVVEWQEVIHHEYEDDPTWNFDTIEYKYEIVGFETDEKDHWQVIDEAYPEVEF